MQATIERILSEKLGVSKAEADEMFNATLEAIREALIEDPDLRIRGLGTFKVVVRKGRTYRNPQTGEPVEKPDTQVVKFIAGKELKEAALAAEI